MRSLALVVTALSLLEATRAGATEYLATGTRLVIKDKSTSKKLVYLSKDPVAPIGVPTPGGPDDPSVAGATFTINASNANGTEIAQFALPTAGWSVQQTPTGPRFRYSNLTAPGSPVRSVMIRAELLKLKAQESGISLDEPSQTAIGVRLDAGSVRWCSSFDANIVQNEPGRFKAKTQDLPPVACVSQTTSTTSTTLPHTCGNGIIEPSEQCDGDEFCDSACAITTSACCQYAAFPTDPECSADMDALMTDHQIFLFCAEVGGTFMLGRHATGSGTCAGGPASILDGPCELVGTVSPTTLCCQKMVTPGCFDGIVNDTSNVSSFYRTCGYTEFQFPVPVVVGTCGPSGLCEPAH